MVSCGQICYQKFQQVFCAGKLRNSEYQRPRRFSRVSKMVCASFLYRNHIAKPRGSYLNLYVLYAGRESAGRIMADGAMLAESADTPAPHEVSWLYSGKDERQKFIKSRHLVERHTGWSAYDSDFACPSEHQHRSRKSRCALERNFFADGTGSRPVSCRRRQRSCRPCR
jgi:hypothetical protein